MTTLEAFRAFAGADPQEDDDLLKAMLDAAKEALTAAGVNACTKLPGLYQYALFTLAAYWYDGRGNAGEVPEGVPGMIAQLKYG